MLRAWRIFIASTIFLAFLLGMGIWYGHQQLEAYQEQRQVIEKATTGHHPAKTDKIQRAVGICAGNWQSGDAAFEGKYLLMQVVGDHQQKQCRRDDRQHTGFSAQAVVL